MCLILTVLRVFQNNLAELWSLLNFILPEIFDDVAAFQESYAPFSPYCQLLILRPTDSRSQPFPTVLLKRAIPCLFTSYTRFSDHSFLDVSK